MDQEWTWIGSGSGPELDNICSYSTISKYGSSTSTLYNLVRQRCTKVVNKLFFATECLRIITCVFILLCLIWFNSLNSSTIGLRIILVTNSKDIFILICVFSIDCATDMCPIKRMSWKRSHSLTWQNVARVHLGAAIFWVWMQTAWVSSQ